MLINKDKLEIQILHYILSDISYLKEIFKIRDIPLKYFSNDDIRRVIRICLDYNSKYSGIIVRDEFIKIIDENLLNKQITIKEHYSLQNIFHDASMMHLEKEQFNRITNDFINFSIKKDVEAIIRANQNLIAEHQPLDFINKVVPQLQSISHTHGIRKRVKVLDINRDVDEQILDLENRRRDPNQYVGIQTGIPVLDTSFVGFEKGTSTVIAAFTSGGKSTFILNISRNIFQMYDKKVLVIPLEMPADQWARKYNSLDCLVKYSDLRTGKPITSGDNGVDRFDEVKNKILERKKLISEKNGDYKILAAPAACYTWEDIIRELDEKLPEYRPDIIFIDYLALISMRDIDEDKRTDKLGELAKKIRSYAQINNISTVIAVQLNRSSIIRKSNKKIMDIGLDNLEDSNKIGEDADSVLALKISPGMMIVDILKQREGPTVQDIGLKTTLEYGQIIDPAQAHMFFHVEHGGQTTSLEDIVAQAVEPYDTGLDEMDDVEKILAYGDKKANDINSIIGIDDYE
ncbi:MAG: DnaB-like helicase C-terminal domain-containing protein [bacterium]|nr:DnaB-like helicase C-terminal domain-containing protein [bacterium]